MVIKSNQTHFSWKPYSVELKFVRLLRYNFVEGQVLEILIYYRTNENAIDATHKYISWNISTN